MELLSFSTIFKENTCLKDYDDNDDDDEDYEDNDDDDDDDDALKYNEQ